MLEAMLLAKFASEGSTATRANLGHETDGAMLYPPGVGLWRLEVAVWNFARREWFGGVERGNGGLERFQNGEG